MTEVRGPLINPIDGAKTFRTPRYPISGSNFNN